LFGNPFITFFIRVQVSDKTVYPERKP